MVYMIRHGEKPDSGNGLNALGLQRAQCLRNVFGKSSSYNIGKIMAQMPQSDGSQGRPNATVYPLSQDLGLKIDLSCQRDDSKCVDKVVDNYSGSGNILICWEHKALTDIATALGDNNAPSYPSDHFDYIWTDPSPYSKVTDTKTSENCPGLDN
ncbi:hypothetical protein EG328_010518 [Venturia inaequalis]|uniref:Phosphoglycerate mutase family protein n=2 Tax=Venturia inaequalis TaxID=5025 RepID=A0A8H3Z7L0_VENIN|nr:hypothetical protein EG328_010518 [Venturia inaequalis]